MIVYLFLDYVFYNYYSKIEILINCKIMKKKFKIKSFKKINII